MATRPAAGGSATWPATSNTDMDSVLFSITARDCVRVGSVAAFKVFLRTGIRNTKSERHDREWSRISVNQISGIC